MLRRGSGIHGCNSTLVVRRGYRTGGSGWGHIASSLGVAPCVVSGLAVSLGRGYPPSLFFSLAFLLSLPPGLFGRFAIGLGLGYPPSLFFSLTFLLSLALCLFRRFAVGLALGYPPSLFFSPVCL